MRDNDTIFMLAQEAVRSRFNPADVEALKSAPGAKEYLIKNLPINMKDRRILEGPYSQASIIASALGEIGEPNDAARLNKVLNSVFEHKLDLESKIAAIGDNPGWRKCKDREMSLSLFKMEKAMVDGAAASIFEAMVKLGAATQALNTVKKFEGRKLADGLRAEMLKFSQLAHSIVQKHASLEKAAISMMKRMPVVGSNNQAGRIAH